MQKVSTVIADRDPGARDLLRELCRNHPQLQLIGECCNAEGLSRVIEGRQPELLIVNLGDDPHSYARLLRALPEGRAPLLIVISTIEAHALVAFELEATDFVLKPLDAARFAATVRKVMARSGAPAGTAPAACVEAQLSAAADRLILEIGEKVYFLELREIVHIESDRNYVWITGRETLRVRASLKELERLLPADRFLRLSRSVIVNARSIVSIERLASGEYSIALSVGKTVQTGRRFRARIQGTVLRRQAVRGAHPAGPRHA